MASSSNDDEYQITSINVTPLVDIMMVLLIIFMVTTTYIVKEVIKVDLPRAADTGESTARTLQIVLSKDGKMYLDGVVADDTAIVRKIQQSTEKREDMQAVISADTDSRHGAVIHLLDVLKSQGLTKFAFEIDKSAH